MKSKNLVPALFISFFVVSLSFAQKDSFVDKAPFKFNKSSTPEAAVGVPSNGAQDKNPNAKTTPIPSDAMFDLIFEYPCAIGGGEAGIETDGIFIYTTKWNGNQFYKYEMDGTFVDSLSISGVSNIRDLAFDGTYFFCGAASPTVYELDLENTTLISSFMAPTDIRAIAYYDEDDTFYANNWGSNITKFDKSGNNLGNFPVGPVGDSYYGFAYDNSPGDTYLWGYAQVGATQNELVQIELPSGAETGVYFDVGSVFAINEGIAGGLCIQTVCYDIIIIGMSQNDFIWGLELTTLGCYAENDLGINSIIEPASGVGGYANNEPVTVRIENHGGNQQSDFIVSFIYNGSQPYFDTVFTTINLGETYDFTFDTTINMSMGGTHTIEACTHLPDDECVFNDCKTKILEGGLYGSVEGYLTDCITGDPIENGDISLGETYFTTTGPDGYFYFDDIPVGTWELNYSAPGYCLPQEQLMVTIVEGQTTTVDNLCLYPAQFQVNPLVIDVLTYTDSITYEYITISNPGNCPIDWNASLTFLSEDGTDDLFDLIWEVPVGVGGGEAGIETNGNYIYTTKWNGTGEFYRYGMDGTYIEQIMVTGTAATRDMAYDGTHFYGSPASTTVYELDLDNATLISSFTAPTDCRAIAYNEDEGVFYANNWGSDITKFDKTGANFGSFPVGPTGDSYYGFAYDNYSSPGTPYLWGYAQVGATLGELIQIDLQNGFETGLTYDIGSALSASDMAGGLSIDDNIQSETWAFLGTCQNVNLWAAELSPVIPVWLTINPTSGTIEPGETDVLELNFDATDIIPGTVKTAEINFYSDPNAGEIAVPVAMTVNSPGLGYITGNVILSGLELYNIGVVTDVWVSASPYSSSPDINGNYTIWVYNGTYDVIASLYGYETQTIQNVYVPGGNQTVSDIDFDLQTIYGRLLGTVNNEDTGDPIENATITISGPDLTGTTGADGYYEIFVEAGTYDIQVDHPLYVLSIVEDIVIDIETDTQQDFELEYSCTYCDASGGGDEYIDGIEMGSIINLGTGYQTGYADYTEMSTVVIPGMTHTLTLYTGNMYSADDYGIWIDWNLDCEFDQVTENVICEVDNGQDIHYFDIDIPSNVNYGLYTMRIRLKYSGGDCGVPCGSTSYGEVEDYSLIIPAPGYGSIEGYLTDCLTGDPIENGTIEIGGLYIITTGADGYFFYETILPGEWELNYSAPGYCLPQETIMVTISGGQTTTIDNLCLYPAEFEVDPDTLYVTMEPNSTTTEIVTLSNPGTCDVDWSVSVAFNQKELFDLQFQYPCAIGGGEAGIETDGNFIYTSKWNGSGIYKYDLNGNYIETLSIGANIRDLAYDGTYFYGAAASPNVFEMDFENVITVSTFSAPTDVRAIAYDHSNDFFIANNWGSNITVFDKTGANLGSFPVGPIGDSYYGFAYDDVVEGGPYLWGYAQVGNTQNELIQIELPAGIETGLYADVAYYLPDPVSEIAGGLFTHSNLMSGTWTIGGLVQNEWLWGLELAMCQPPWLYVDDPTTGTLPAGSTEDMSIFFNSVDLLPGVYEADLIFTISPVIDPEIVHVILTVEGFMPPVNLSLSYSCTDIGLSWEVPPPAQPDSFYVYRNDTLIAVVPPSFTDTMVFPEVEYSYYVVALYNGIPSIPSQTLFITVPTPENLEPFDLEAIIHYPDEYDVTLLWEEPTACLSPDGYNIFRNDEQINSTLVIEPTYIDPDLPGNFYEYYVTAVYYFGESDPSNPTYALFYDIDEFNFEICRIYPNPSDGLLNIESGYPIRLVQIFDIHGKFLFDKIINCKKSRIDISFFEPGIYFLKIQTKNAIFNQKIILQ